MEKVKEFFQNEDEINLEMEELIAKNLDSFFDEPKLITLKVSVIHRILFDYIKYNPKADMLPLINFVFKCIDIKGRDAAVLFGTIPLSKHEDYLFDKIYTRFNELPEILLFLNTPHHIHIFNKMKYLEEENAHLKTLINDLLSKS